MHMTATGNGAKCGPVSEYRQCNDQACPEDCSLGEWGEWLHCTRECGGGEQKRFRAIDRPAAYGGQTCDVANETVGQRLCNTQRCEEDCLLYDWLRSRLRSRLRL